MDDEKIIELYFSRSERAIALSNEKYGSYCNAVAYRILASREESIDCVNETWLRAWGTIPPERPKLLKAFFARITRNLALNRLDYNNAKKRRKEISGIAEEFWECVSGEEIPLDDELVLKDAINSFLESLDTRTRVIFMQRYWYAMSVRDIARNMGLSQTHLSVILFRTRDKLKEHLQERGVFL